jgi:subtilisin family serine protease
MIQALKGLEISQAPLRGLLKARQASIVRPLWMINGIAFSAPAWLVLEIAGQPEVERIALDSMVSVPPITPALATISEWNIDAIRAPLLWNSGFTEQGVIVATMDTGVDVLHPDLAFSWRGGSNSWFDPNHKHATPTDVDGHGTGTMGIIVGGSAGGTNIGVAPGAQWIAVKIFNDNGFATLSAIHEGFQWLLDPDGNPATDDAPDVVSNSWSLDGSLNT